MKQGGGHYKGSEFEREISRRLSLWWTQDLPEPRDDIFWRTSGSGARATTRGKALKRTAYEYGDITCRDPIGKPLIDLFLIETKRGYSDGADLLDLLNPKKETYILDWWRKADKEMRQAGRRNKLIILSRNRRKTVVFFDLDFLNLWEMYSGIMNYFWYIKCVLGDEKLVVMDFEGFLKNLQPNDIVENFGVK